VTGQISAPPTTDIRDARELFPATADLVYLNTAAVGLASRRLADTNRSTIVSVPLGDAEPAHIERLATALRSAGR
jgi:hypothetical protein